MQANVRPVLLNGRSFGVLALDIGKPILGGLLNRDAAIGWSVNAFSNIGTDGVVADVGVPLLREGLDMTLAFLVSVITDPRLALLAVPGNPTALSD